MNNVCVWYRKMRHSIELHSQNRKELMMKKHNSISNVIRPRNEANDIRYTHILVHAYSSNRPNRMCAHRMALETAKQWQKWKNTEIYKNYPKQLFCLGSNTLFRVVDLVVSIPLTLSRLLFERLQPTHTLAPHIRVALVVHNVQINNLHLRSIPLLVAIALSSIHVKSTTQCLLCNWRPKACSPSASIYSKRHRLTLHL